MRFIGIRLNSLRVVPVLLCLIRSYFFSGLCIILNGRELIACFLCPMCMYFIS